MSYLTMNSFYIGNNVSKNSYKKYFDKDYKINSAQIKRSIFQRKQENNNKNIEKNQNQKENEIKNNKMDLYNNNSFINFFYKPQVKSQYLSKRENLINMKKINNTQRPISLESSENIKKKNNFLDYISRSESLTSKNFFNQRTRNIFNNLTDINNDIKINDDEKINEKLNELNNQIEEHEKIINNLKEENIHLKNIILNSGIQLNLNNNNYLFKGSRIQRNNSDYFDKLDLLTKKLNILNNEYENYKKESQTRFNSLKLDNIKNDDLYQTEISRLKTENVTLKNEYKILKDKFNNSDVDYIQLLKRNEILNNEIFRLKNIIYNRNSIENFSIYNFSFEIKNKTIKQNKKEGLLKRFYSSVPKTNNSNLNFIKINNDNSVYAEKMIYNLETENTFLINKVQKLEDQVHNYLRIKMYKKKNSEQFRNWSSFK